MFNIFQLLFLLESLSYAKAENFIAVLISPRRRGANANDCQQLTYFFLTFFSSGPTSVLIQSPGLNRSCIYSSSSRESTPEPWRRYTTQRRQKWGPPMGACGRRKEGGLERIWVPPAWVPWVSDSLCRLRVPSQETLSKDMPSEVSSLHSRLLALESADYFCDSDDLWLCSGWQRWAGGRLGPMSLRPGI